MEVADFFWCYWWEQEKGRTVFSFEISQVKHLFKNMLTVDFMIDLLLQTFAGGGLQCLSSTYTVGKKKKKIIGLLHLKTVANTTSLYLTQIAI